MVAYTKADAEFSPCGKHRNRLWREWEMPGAIMADETTPLSFTVVGVNPSIAGKHDDPTIRRVVGFARREGYRRIDMVNLSTFIATDPSDMLKSITDEPMETLEHAYRAIELAGQVVLAWGANGYRHYDLRRRAVDVGRFAANTLPDGPLCWGVTKDGYPKHPVRLAASTPLVPFRAV